MSFLTLLMLEFHRKFITLKRYPLNFYASIFFAAVVIIMVISGATYLSGGELSTQRMESTILGYYLWTLTVGISSTAAEDIVEDTKLGTLPNILTSKRTLLTILFARKTVLVIYQLLVVGVGFAFINWLYKLSISLNFLFLIAFFQVLISGYAVSYFLGGIALINKQMSTFVAFVQLVLLIIFLVPIEIDTLFLVPFSGSMQLVRSASESIEVNIINILCSSLSSVAFFIISLAFFTRMYNRAKQNDVLMQL